MRKLTIALAVLSVVGASALPAGAARTRVETFEYTGAGQVETDKVGVWFGPICFGGQDACVNGNAQYRTARVERAVSVKIVDDQGATVRGMLIQKGGLRKSFCGSSGRTRIRGGKPLGVWISGNPCGATPSGAPTTGTVTTTFIRK